MADTSFKANESPFMNKDISVAIMNRATLSNKLLKHRYFEDKMAYNRQRNLCLLLIQKTKTDYYNHHHKVICNKSF